LFEDKHTDTIHSIRKVRGQIPLGPVTRNFLVTSLTSS